MADLNLLQQWRQAVFNVGCRAHVTEADDFAELEHVLSLGVDINAEFEDGLGRYEMTTAVHYFTGNRKRFEVLEFLVEHGADLNAVTGSDRWSPLHFAAYCGFVPSVKKLLSYSQVDVNMIGGLPLPGYEGMVQGPTALHHAVSQGQIEVVKLLLKHPSIDVNSGYNTETGSPPLLHCTDVECAKLLLEHGADISYNSGHIDVLSMSLLSHKPEMVQLFLDFGANARRAIMILNENQNIRGIIERSNGGNGLELIDEYANTIWKDCIPSLQLLCAWKVKRMRSQLDEEYCCDSVFPDAMCWEHFRDWKGAEKWIQPWLQQQEEDEDEGDDDGVGMMRGLFE